jgi:hypothetical protein
MQKINTKHLPDLDVTTKQPIFHEKDSGSCWMRLKMHLWNLNSQKMPLNPRRVSFGHGERAALVTLPQYSYCVTVECRCTCIVTRRFATHCRCGCSIAAVLVGVMLRRNYDVFSREKTSPHKRIHHSSASQECTASKHPQKIHHLAGAAKSYAGAGLGNIHTYAMIPSFRTASFSLQGSGQLYPTVGRFWWLL